MNTFTNYMYAGLRSAGKALHISPLANAGTTPVAPRGMASKSTSGGGVGIWLAILGLLAVGTWFTFKRQTNPAKGKW